MPRNRFANLARSLVDRSVSRGGDRHRGAIAACIELCGDLRYCVEPLHGPTRCTRDVLDAPPPQACVTDQDCQDSSFPWCVLRVTDLQTGETTPAGGSAFCARLAASA